MRKTNFHNIAIRGNTKAEIDELKRKLQEDYLPNATYDDLLKALLEKNKRIKMSPKDLKILLAKSKGVNW